MTHEDRETFVTMMQALTETFRRDLSEALIQSYWSALAHLALEEVSHAIQRSISESRFMPTPVEILDRRGHKPEPGSPRIPAGESFDADAEHARLLKKGVLYWAPGSRERRVVLDRLKAMGESVDGLLDAPQREPMQRIRREDHKARVRKAAADFMARREDG